MKKIDPFKVPVWFYLDGLKILRIDITSPLKVTLFRNAITVSFEKRSIGIVCNWVLRQPFGTGKSSGQMLISEEQFSRMFNLTDKIEEEKTTSNEYVEKYHVTDFECGIFIRYGDKLNFPGPSVSSYRDLNISIEIYPELQDAMRILAT